MAISTEAQQHIVADHFHDEENHHGEFHDEHGHVDPHPESHAAKHPKRNGLHHAHHHMQTGSVSFTDKLRALINSPRGTMKSRMAAQALLDNMTNGLS